LVSPEGPFGRHDEGQREAQTVRMFAIVPHCIILERSDSMKELRPLFGHGVEEVQGHHAVFRGIHCQRRQCNTHIVAVDFSRFEIRGFASDPVDDGGEE